MAKHIPGSNREALEQLGARATGASGEVARAHLLVLERGDKLSQLEDRTERMSNQAAGNASRPASETTGRAGGLSLLI